MQVFEIMIFNPRQLGEEGKTTPSSFPNLAGKLLELQLSDLAYTSTSDSIPHIFRLGVIQGQVRSRNNDVILEAMFGAPAVIVWCFESERLRFHHKSSSKSIDKNIWSFSVIDLT